MKHNFHIRNINDFATFHAMEMIKECLDNNDGRIPKNQKVDIEDEKIDSIPVDYIKDEIIEDRKAFNEKTKIAFKFKINYLIAEGFMYESDKDYIFYTDQQLKEQLDIIAQG
jgi:hypothetical protein